MAIWIPGSRLFLNAFFFSFLFLFFNFFFYSLLFWLSDWELC